MEFKDHSDFDLT